MYYMGIDLHKKYFVSTIMDKEGKVLISTHFLVKNTLFQKSIADFGVYTNYCLNFNKHILSRT